MHRRLPVRPDTQCAVRRAAGSLANNLLGSHSWQLADAGWSPDFPTSAANALKLYALKIGRRGHRWRVIGLNTYAVDDLLEATGPIEVPEYGVTVAPQERPHSKHCR